MPTELASPGLMARQVGPPVDQAHRVGDPRPQPVGVVVGHEFGFVGGDVHLDRAVALAALAGDAQVEGLEDVVVAPQVRQRLALEHLPQKAGPAPGGVAFLVRGLERRAHRPAGLAPALADADAARHRLRDRAAVVGQPEDRLGVAQLHGRTQVRVEGHRVHDLARVHAPARIPDRLELAERPDQLQAEHPGQQLRPSLPVAVLARKGAAVADDQVGGLVDEGAEGAQAGARAEVELGAQVQAAVAEVAVEGALEAEPADQRVQFAHVGAQPFRRNGRILPARVGGRLAGDNRRSADGGFAQCPERLLAGPIDDDSRAVAMPEPVGGRARLRLGLRGSLAAEFDEQPAAAFGQPGDGRQVQALAPAGLDQPVVEAFQADRAGLHDLGRSFGRLEDVAVAKNRERPTRRAGHEPDGRLQDGDARAFGPDQRPGDVEAVLRQQRLQREAGHEPRQLRIALANERPVAIPEGAEGAVDVAPRAGLRAEPRPAPRPWSGRRSDAARRRSARRATRRCRSSARP